MDLDAIEAAYKAMTPGPWEVVPASNMSRTVRRIFGESYIGTIGGSDDSKAIIDANADGIVTLRNAAPEMIRRIRDQDAEIKRLRRFVKDMGTTCYSCEACGHARTTRECLRCEIKGLRALCGDAIPWIDRSTHNKILTREEAIAKGIEEGDLIDRLRAASKGEQ